jgi:hypothetical protein
MGHFEAQHFSALAKEAGHSWELLRGVWTF